MLSVLISYLYIAFTTLMLGFSIGNLMKKYLGYEIRELTSIFYAGIGVATVYSGIYSLYTGVGFGANVLLVIICVGIFFLYRNDFVEFIQRQKNDLTKGRLITALMLLLIFSYGASRGYLHFDSGLYHAQAIRWIEEYGVVPGLANLHCRLAYNSSAFTLTALYSMKFIAGQSLHTVAGFMAMILCGKAVSVVQVFTRRKVLISDFVKVALLFYISIIYTEMMSPASDYFAMLLLFYIVLTWIELEEKQENNITPYSMLCVLLAVTVTVKLSAAIMLIMVLKPAIILVKEKRYVQIVVYLSLGILTVFPYLARNVILSGWLVYPFPGIDLFSFDWKIPVGEARYDAEEIRVYAKGMADVLLKDLPMNQWLPNWFSGLKGLEKIWVLSSVVSLVAGTVAIIYGVIKKDKKNYGLYFLEVVLIAGYLFWQIGTPLVRYGYIYILAYPFFTVGLWFSILCGKKDKSYMVFALALILFFAYKGIGMVQSIVASVNQDYYVWQRDYETWDYSSYEIDGIEFYIPLQSGQIGYDKFPGVPYERYDVELRRNSLKEGFRRTQP